MIKVIASMANSNVQESENHGNFIMAINGLIYPSEGAAMTLSFDIEITPDMSGDELIYTIKENLKSQAYDIVSLTISHSEIMLFGLLPI